MGFAAGKQSLSAQPRGGVGPDGIAQRSSGPLLRQHMTRQKLFQSEAAAVFDSRSRAGRSIDPRRRRRSWRTKLLLLLLSGPEVRDSTPKLRRLRTKA